MSDADQNDDLSNDEVSIEALPAICFDCGFSGVIRFPEQPEIDFRTPPPESPKAGRLILASVKNGSLKTAVSLKDHEVVISHTPDGSDSKLLIRIAIGVRVFKVVVDPKKPQAFFFGYETSDGYNVVPFRVEKSKVGGGPAIQAVALLATPVPPQHANESTASPSFKPLTIDQWKTRRDQADNP
jgi:hypothetical protein